MNVRGPGRWSLPAAALLLAVGCGARALDPGVNPPTTGTAGQGMQPDPGPMTDLIGALKALTGPDQLLVLGSNAGAVTSISTPGPFTGFLRDPETLDEAAAVVGMPVCSVEFQSLTFGETASDPSMLTVPAALDTCLKEDLQPMLETLGALKTPSTVVVIAANTGITDHSTNNGINFYYDADIVRLLHSARKLYVPVCNIAPQTLSLPSPQGQTTGVSIEDALASCGRM
ncbi:MAG TPA: hypothetical protein VKQ32_28575 [Polyangia bacterium]|nr:hypothetical protein [Polyangia bacterium]